MGFYVANESDRITVRNDSVSDMTWPYWTHDSLIHAFAAKFRRLVVKGTRQRSQVRYETAHRIPGTANYLVSVFTTQ